MSARVADLWRNCGLPALEARALLARVLGCTRERLLAHPEQPVDDGAAARWRALLRRRLEGEPFAYLVGEREFHGHCFLVGPDVLVPRPETELLVDTALELLRGHPRARVLELGTGSGCIAISLALARPDLRILATEISAPALAIARANASRLGAAVRYATGSWYEALVEVEAEAEADADADRRFALVVSNPPYVAAGDPHLESLRHEPTGALTDGGDGLGALRAIVAGARARLVPGGALLVEHGHDQGDAVRALALAAGLADPRTLADLAGTGRATLARNPTNRNPAMAQDAQKFIRETIEGNPVVLFMKGTAQFPQCGFSGRAVQILQACKVDNLVTVNVLEDDEVRQAIKEHANWPTIPQLYVHGKFVGGSDILAEMFESGELQSLLGPGPSA
jgi:release factor glutamine methyltransferase